MNWLRNVSKFKINELFEKSNSFSYSKINNDILFIVYEKDLTKRYFFRCYEEFNKETGEIIYNIYDRKEEIYSI